MTAVDLFMDIYNPVFQVAMQACLSSKKDFENKFKIFVLDFQKRFIQARLVCFCFVFLLTREPIVFLGELPSGKSIRKGEGSSIPRISS